MAAKTKRVPKEMLSRVGGIVRELVSTKFDNNQTRAAKALECSQSTLSAIISGDRGPGLNTLLALRDATGRSIDDLLGLSRTPSDALVRELTESVAYFRRMRPHDEPSGRRPKEKA